MLVGFLVQMIQHLRSRTNELLHIRILRVQNTQRVLVEAANTILIQLVFHAGKVAHQLLAVGAARRVRAERVDLQLQAPKPQSGPQAGTHDNQLGIHVRAGEAQGLNIKLMKLAVPPFLRFFITKHRTGRPELLPLIVQ